MELSQLLFRSLSENDLMRDDSEGRTVGAVGVIYFNNVNSSRIINLIYRDTLRNVSELVSAHLKFYPQVWHTLPTRNY
jgi:hypothetical protein